MRINRNVRINTDNKRPKISCGFKNAKNLPEKCFYFVIVNPETGENYYPELEAIYGDKPEFFYVSFPSNELADFFNDDFNLWQANNTKRRTCNTEDCTHIVTETIEGVEYKGGTVSECVCLKHELFETEDKELKKIKCKCDVYLKAWILHPATLKPISPICYLFENHSPNSADNIYSEFYTPDNIKKFNYLIGYPFVLSVKKVKKADNSTFPILNLCPHIPLDKLIDYNKTMAIEFQGSHLIEDKEETETPKEEQPKPELPKNSSNSVHYEKHFKFIAICNTSTLATARVKAIQADKKLNEEEQKKLIAEYIKKFPDVETFLKQMPL